MRWEESDRLGCVGVAPIIVILSAVVLYEPVTDGEPLVREIVGLPDGEAVWVSTEELLRTGWIAD